MAAYGCSTVQEKDSLSGAYEALAQCMGDSNLTYEKRLRAARMLDLGDKEVIPVLIDHLGDNRTYNPQYREISESAEADRDVPTRVMTVGEICEVTLNIIVFGPVRGIPMRVRIDNWPSWWSKNKQKSFAEIQADAKRLLLEAKGSQK
jgi:hypothetical protein